ncbi:hypothetical protein ABE61_19650 [Lysinibacillus sphaericus]|uniref:DUF3267 domain-containing protein n=1 Tax=Lysinibacillus sphaericus TaxID=1421 RepID=UPI0018CD3B17|nr:DUF3267 domain-containing protein [Lysinibacillus sphaericus]MBG9456193.1 hypothetical protein [Lysinibacillus sphaericus]MBG9479189.1 hypothetical protein [Lysinibacillus sphaericus]MBG9591513.1 hypothetical protein [Lysinibacillus sphaericus]
MKILNKLPKSNPNLHVKLIKNGWISMKEPENLLSAIWLSIPLMIITSMISIGVIKTFSSISLSDFGFTPDGLSITINLNVILWIALLLIIHELLHLIFIPNFIKSEKTSVGFTLFGAFVITEEEISKSRYIFITVAPFIILSILLPLILSVFGLLTTTLKYLVILNAMGSSVDLLNLLLIMKQVPKNATLTCNGPNTYWKKDQTG